MTEAPGRSVKTPANPADKQDAEKLALRRRLHHLAALYGRLVAVLGGFPRGREPDPQAITEVGALLRDAGLFDPDWYRAHHRDVAESGQDPASHYLAHGAWQGRMPVDLGALTRRQLNARPGHYSPEDPVLLASKQALRRHLTQQLYRFLASDEKLVFRPGPAPRLSVILVVWNQAAFTLNCLQALDRDLDIVVIDNASEDRTGALLERCEGISVCRNSENQGFVKAVNLAMTMVAGEHVLLVNNDAAPRAGALATALTTLTSDPGIGAVGGRIILPDGRLQEAGCIVWRDGSCQGYARGEAPDSPHVLFRRPVDYCSGVFLMFRAGLFKELGGFDEAFAPAYYEETDFCLRLWDNGYQVVYEPEAVIDHFEFASAPTQADSIALQQRNRSIFRTKHATRLDRHHFARSAGLIAARHCQNLQAALAAPIRR